MFVSAEYQLVDFGAGRKLERIGEYLLDRPSPAAELEDQSEPSRWRAAAGRYERTSGDRGVWRGNPAHAAALPPRWTIRHGGMVLELRPSPFGHLGIFPEQADNWDWITKQVAAARRPIKVLNLFAYTGASTLAAAAAGAEVVHVDAARNTVAWARRNAELSNLSSAPIRWIHEDAATFVLRELKRGNRYDAIILDPPTYGHGAKGDVWKLTDDLAPLLADCGRLITPDWCFLLLTCHTPGFGPEELRSLIADTIGARGAGCGPMELKTPDGRVLPSGAFARLSARDGQK